MPPPQIPPAIVSRQFLGALGVFATLNPNLGDVIGDSRAQNFSTTAATPGLTTYKNLQHPLVWAMAFMGQRLRIVGNFGNAGKRSDQWQTLAPLDTRYSAYANNVQAALSTPSLWTFFSGIGVNDIAQGYTADQIWQGYNGAPSLKSCFLTFIAAGKRPVIFLEAGSSSMNTAALVTEVHRLNDYLRNFCQSNPQAIPIDVPSITWDTTSTSTTGIAQKAGYYESTGTHFNYLGAYNVAAAPKIGVVAVMSPLIPPLPKQVSAASQIPSNGRIQLNPTPLFLPSATAQGAVTGFTFSTNMPAGLTFARGLNGAYPGGAATCTASIITDPNGFGQALQLQITWSQAKEEITVSVALDTTSILAGDQLFGAAHMEVAAGSSNSGIGYHFIRMTPDTGTQTYAYDLYGDVSIVDYGPCPTVAYQDDSETGVMTVPTYVSTIAGIQRFMFNSSGGSGSMTVTISRAGVFKQLS